MGYGYYFCHRYDINYDKFSWQGQMWINSVKLCLQNDLLPVLNNKANYDCDTLKSFAFSTHAKCYLGNNGEFYSICDLGLSDWGLILKTIYSGIKSLDGMKQIWQIGMEGCLWSDWGMRTYHLVFKNNFDQFTQYLDKLQITMDEFGEIIKNKLFDYFKGLENGIIPMQMQGGDFYEGSVIFELYVFLNDTNLDYIIKKQIQYTMNDSNFYNIAYMMNSSQTLNISINTANETNFTLYLSEIRANVTGNDDGDSNNNGFDIDIVWKFIMANKVIAICIGVGVVVICCCCCCISKLCLGNGSKDIAIYRDDYYSQL